MSLFLPPLSLSLSLSLSMSGVDLAARDPELDTGQFKSLAETLNQSRSLLTLAGKSPLSLLCIIYP